MAYCSQKFWWLTVEPEKRTVTSCCAATPHRVNFDNLDLFNSPELKQDRQHMLDDQLVPSCESVCWQAERQGRVSRRLAMGSDKKTHVDIESTPTTLHIVLGSDCNLTCSYCCKQYSSAWLRDIEANGAYLDEERYRISVDDKIVSRLGQRAIKQSDSYQRILNAALQYSNVEETEITGGEPFLYNGLEDVVARFNNVNIFTGLGVDTARFSRMLDKLPRTIKLTISAENTGALYEFNRYGNTWARFQQNLAVVEQLGFDYQFCSVISNTTIQGFRDFLDLYGHRNIIINPCTDPQYLSAAVIDDDTKEIVNSCKYDRYDDIVKRCINSEVDKNQVDQFKQYITQFVNRRNITFDAFPKSFQTWINK